MDVKLETIITQSKSKHEILIKFFGYTNELVYQKLNQYLKENNINVSHLLKIDKTCLFCGKKIKRSNKFCDQHCSAKYNNKNRTHSEETKQKIAKSLCERNHKGRVVKCKSQTCVICHQNFEPKINNNNKRSKSKTCSDECRFKLKSNNSKKIMNDLVRNGKHKGWVSRNVISYPENFFIKVLTSHNIPFKHNHPISKRTLGINENYNYFLDFYLTNKNIDLEIDGKQHQLRQQCDQKRDETLKNNGFRVYRIKWKSINTESGKKYIEGEINKFLRFYNTINCPLV